MSRYPIYPSTIGICALVSLTLWSSGARADLHNKSDTATVFAPVGFLGSASNRAAGIGAELTLDTNLRVPGWGVGLLAQYERLSDRTNRLTGGGQLLFYFMGVELGIAHCNALSASDTALHLAPFVSAYGVLSAALRFDLPMFHSGPAPPTVEVGLAVTLKFPIPINGHMP